MPKKRLQRIFLVGAEYQLKGSRSRSRRLKFVGRVRIDGHEHLIFRPVRKVAKRKPKKAARRRRPR